MTKKKILLTLGLALVLAAGGIATASNMGFKVVKSYTGPASVANTVSLPYFQSQFANVTDMFNDNGSISRICLINAATQPSPCWFSGSGTGIPINNQNGLLVNVTGSTTQVIVGSHNPALTLSLTGPASVANVKSIPYHATYPTLAEVFADVPNASRICKFNAATQPSPCWFSGTGAAPAVTIGEALLINVTASSNTWVPDHY